MLKEIINKIIGDSSGKEIKKILPLVEQINKIELDLQNISEDQLKAKTQEFKDRIEKGETLDDILPEAFAVVKNACRRLKGKKFKILGKTELEWDMIPYDVQLIGGIVLHKGKISEMKTGEGKTLVASLPLYLNALEGKGSFLITVNDYLAKRDSEWMGFLYEYLGLTVGCAVHGMDHEEKKAAYESDITYGTNNEFGFDYLRDNMAIDLEQIVQRDLNFAIVDEVDSILIDEARTPLIISAPAEESTEKYFKYALLIKNLEKDKDYTIDEKHKAAVLTEDGIQKMESLIGVENIYEEAGFEEVHHIEQALKAQTLFQKDTDYVVKDGEVIIVDEFTGRLMPGRRYSDGLHQAIEAKENVEVKRESRTLATVTFQNYFRLFNKLAGMTGTAETEAEEFMKIYGLDVVVIPTNRPIARDDKNDSIYKNEYGKFLAVASATKEKYEIGQPVLIGTISIEKSEVLSNMLKRKGIPHNVLNAKHHEREAEIVAKAGQKGSVTIATNMAGRGTDIKLQKGLDNEICNGIIEKMKKAQEEGKKLFIFAYSHFAKERFEYFLSIYDKNPIEGFLIDENKLTIKNFQGNTDEETEELEISFGLAIIGTERHESRRIDNQLRGRAGRQGDPGMSQFFVSMEDDLMRLFGADKIKSMMDKFNIPDDMPIENKMVSRGLESAQKRVEGYNFDMRKHVVEYDDVMNFHREIIYSRRKEILKSKDIKLNILELIKKEIEEIVNSNLGILKRFDWNLEELSEILNSVYRDERNPINADELESYDYPEELASDIKKKFLEFYEKKEEEAPSPEALRMAELSIYLQTIDRLWMEHIDNMSRLRERVALAGYGQRNPLIEYKNLGHSEFRKLTNNIRSQTVKTLFHIKIQETPIRKEEESIDLEKLRTNEEEIEGNISSSRIGAGDEIKKIETSKKPDQVKKVGRNELCPCGSGKKYKKCCGRQ